MNYAHRWWGRINLLQLKSIFNPINNHKTKQVEIFKNFGIHALVFSAKGSTMSHFSCFRELELTLSTQFASKLTILLYAKNDSRIIATLPTSLYPT